MSMDEYRKQIFGASGDRVALMSLEKQVSTDKELSRDDRTILLKGIDARLKGEVKDTIAKERIAEADTTVKPLAGDEIGDIKPLAQAKVLNNVKIIGHIVGYTIGQCAIPNEIILEYWEKHKIAEGFRPHFCRTKDAFKNACARMEYVESEVPADDRSDRLIRTELKSRQLSQTEYMLSRHKVEVKGRMSKDPSKEVKHTISHENIVKFELLETVDEVKDGQKGGVTEKKTKFIVKSIPQHKKYMEDALRMGDLVEGFVEWFENHTTDKRLRDAIRETIRKVGGVNFTMGQGGAWFVPITAEAPTSQYKEFFKFVDETYRTSYNPVLLRTIPLIDDYDVRAQIQEDVAKEVQKQMERRLTKTLKSLTGVDPVKAEKILEAKLKEHGKSLELLGRYKTLLARDIKVDLEKPDPSGIKLKGHKELSGRGKMLLEMLTTSEEIKE